MRTLQVFGWTVVAVLTARAIVMFYDPIWWNYVISDIRQAGETLINRTLFTAANELIIAGFIALSLTTSWNMQSALWLAALLAIGHVSVDISRHILEQSTRDTTSFIYIQNHIIYPMIVLYAAIYSKIASKRESRYLNSGFTY